MLSGHTQPVKALAVLPLSSSAGATSRGSPNSASATLLVSGSRDCCVRLWDFKSGECLHKSHILRNIVTSIRAFPKQQTGLVGYAFVQTSEDLRLRFWTVENQQGGEPRLVVKH